MKKQLLLLVGIVTLHASVFAQNNVNLVIFSEDGDSFFAYINGVKQNSKPETNVKVTGLNPNISLRIEFENKALPQLKQTMALDPGFEHTARIKRDMKKQLKLRYFGSVPLNEAQAGIPTVAYHSAEEPSATVNTSGGDNGQNVNMNTNVNVSGAPQVKGNTTITSSTTTTTKSNGNIGGNNENASVNINVGGMGINMNVNGMGMDENSTVQTTTSTTVTTSHSSSSSSSFEEPVREPARPSTQTNVNTTPRNVGCSAAMSPANFAKMKQSVESKPFSDTKMSTAKVATKSGCLSTSQVKEICKLFAMDDDKLAYAKFAYDYCVDKANYYTVSDVFSFSGTTDEFNKFLEH